MSSFDPNVILKSKLGILRLVAVGVGLFAVAFVGAGHAHQEYLRDRIKIDEAYAQRVFGKSACPDNAEFGRCYGPWAGDLGLALIIIAWLFAIVMLIVSALPSLSQNPPVRMADGFGHIGAGVLGILGALLCVWWVVNIYLANFCDKKDSQSEGRSLAVSRKSRSKSDSDSTCSDGVFFTISECIGYCGYKGWLWLAGAIFAIGFGIVCIVIFALAKKTGPRGPMMMGGMMTQQPSQAPMSMHPSQMTQQQQQQQNPDQQSVHPSQMTQQQG